MEAELKSGWLVTQIELLKTLHGYEKKGVNNKIGYIDYVASDGDEKKLLRVVIDPKLNTSKAYPDIIRSTKELLENENYGDAVILAEKVSQGAKKLIREEESLDYISPALKHPYSLTELIYAIQKKTGELCKLRCGKVPKTESDCKGYQDGEYTCPVRQISDNANFHAERGWLELLMNDFSQLVGLQREMNE